MLIAVPNISEGRDLPLIGNAVAAVASAGARVLDVHSDAVHNRSVLTLAAEDDEQLVDGAVELARWAQGLDLTLHTGVHPRLGMLDVCPFVPHEDRMERAVAASRQAAGRIGRLGFPVYLYGEAANRDQTRELPVLRRMGLTGLADLPPDEGPAQIEPRTGVVCVGARGPLIAFNVWISGDETMARSLAAQVRTSGGGPPGIRALGWAMDATTAQVSMNLIEPDITGIDEAFDVVEERAESMGVEILGTEIVGLVEARYLPADGKRTARLLREPGRSLEEALAD